MPADKTKSLDYKSLSSVKNGGANSRDQSGLKSQKKSKKSESFVKGLTNPFRKIQKQEIPSEPMFEENAARAEIFVSESKIEKEKKETLTYAEEQKQKKEEKRSIRDFKLLSGDEWLTRNGHTLTYIGLYLFSILVLFRPYEIIPSLSFLSATAFYFAAATLLIYIPTQLSTEGTLTVFSTEVKAILVLTFLALVTMPVSKDVGMAWETFNDPFIKVVLMFIVMVNVLRTRRRLMGLVWLSLAIGIYLSYTAWDMYLRGELNAEGYRVTVEIGGMFGNPNDMALHLVIMTPIALCLGIAAKNNLMRLVYFVMTILFIAGNFVTYSRGGFLGLIASAGVLAWKIGRKSRLNVALASIFSGAIVLLLAPGNYGLRLLSIFIPGLDPVGSSDQRRELLERSIIVSLRNPWGIGIGNFPIVGIRNLQSHNAFTQVSSELGCLGLAAYLIFMISPFRKLGAIERTLFKKGESGWFYYLAIGLQASIVGYMVSSFFNSVAYNWFVYYLIAYAVAFRRIYSLEKGIEEVQAESIKEKVSRLKNVWQNG
ncbi:MAG TPA: O-antigen ligase family protein [Pyrinomonadaceae bacterium]|nr:O-antigen ligase family protein [Pyrinomonadaceae bacterium]